VEAYVDLSAMALGDKVIVRQYVKQSLAGTYIPYGSQTLSDKQVAENGDDMSMLWVRGLPVSYGVKLTLQQTAGVMRTITYTLFKEIRI